jgi:hypothetical protein
MSAELVRHGGGGWGQLLGVEGWESIPGQGDGVWSRSVPIGMPAHRRCELFSGRRSLLSANV